MLVPSIPFAAKSEVATLTIIGRFVSGFCSNISILLVNDH
jgi:hypothetical protein